MLTRPSNLGQVAKMLRAGKVYRREDLAKVFNAVDRHLSDLVSGGESEFLLVDAINNLDELAEDKNQVLQMVECKLPSLDQAKLKRAVSLYGSVATQKRFGRWLNA
jgi:hypothetical protein